MLANGGNPEGLFRAAFMQSGSPTPVGDITHVGNYIVNSFNSKRACRVNNIMISSLQTLVARALPTPWIVCGQYPSMSCRPQLITLRHFSHIKFVVYSCCSPDVRTSQLTISQSLDLAWQPRADGVFLADGPEKLVLQGKVARVPFVAGECDDEGTLFSLSQTNVT